MPSISKNFVSLPLTTGKGENIRVPYRSGLNWGQRPNRDENQAYLGIPADIQKSIFFPMVGIAFEISCDDGFKMLCVRAQQNGKGLHTQKSNAIMGKYFRERLGLSSGEMVTIDHLINYGRISVDIFQLVTGEYFLDFSTTKYMDEFMLNEK